MNSNLENEDQLKPGSGPEEGSAGGNSESKATDSDSPAKNAKVNSVISDEEKSFEELSEEANVGLIREFVDFLKYNKKWWLTPIIAVLLLVGLLIVLTTSGAAPFLYTFW